MRVLGIETSSRRGTVALMDSGRLVVTLASDVPGGHAEHLLGLVDKAMSEAGWPKKSLDRIGVGVGPGSFTGIRVGVALALGIGMGLGKPVLGVGSLRAMARGLPPGVKGARCALVDARRGEVFCAEYDETSVEVRGPRPVRREEVAAWLAEAAEPRIVIGEVAAELGLSPRRSETTDLPHASGVAELAAVLSPEEAPATAAYVRPADAIRPNLPRSPLSSGGT